MPLALDQRSPICISLALEKMKTWRTLYRIVPVRVEMTKKTGKRSHYGPGLLLRPPDGSSNSSETTYNLSFFILLS